MDMGKLSGLARMLTEGMPQNMKEDIAKESTLMVLCDPFIELRTRVDASILSNEKTLGFTHEESTALVDSVMKDLEIKYLEAKERIKSKEGLSF